MTGFKAGSQGVTRMRYGIMTAMLLLQAGLTGCAGGSALQPDRSIFSLDNNYQRFAYALSIEETFDRTLAVFRDAGYKLDVIDRATGQISGKRGATGDKGSLSDKDLKFYALVLPREQGSELSIKIVQVIKSGALGASRAELIVNDPQMYQYAFRRIENGVGSAEEPPAPGRAVMPGW